MRTRRTVALGLSAVMAVSVLSGCGSSSSSTTADTKGESNASAESSTEPVVVSYRITCNNGNQRTLINP